MTDAPADQPKHDDTSPQAIARFWRSELTLAKKRFDAWWTEADQCYCLYEAESEKQNSYNILWSNTEVLRPALYNSTPTPDVRRRFRDEDVLGKTVSKVLQRALDYAIDDYDEEDFDGEMKAVVLDTLITGRGVSRVRYVPVFVPMAGPADPSQASPPPIDDALSQQPGGPPRGRDAKELFVDATGTPERGRDAKVLYLQAAGEEEPAIDDPFAETEVLEGPFEGAMEPDEPQQQVADESADCEHVYYRDFMHSAGRKWGEVWWTSFRHRLDRTELVQMFGEAIGGAIKLDEIDKDDKRGDKDLDEQHKTAEVFEIWDKRKRECIFISMTFEDQPLLTVPDPLQLTGFWPAPKPLYAIESTRSLLPIPPYRLYKQQAAELNRISTRINKITEAMKVRGAYMASNAEAVVDIMAAGDNELTPIVDPTMLASGGGIDKLIWMMPLDKLAMALQQLYLAREQIKQVIAELTGLSDIVRGSTDPNETKGAQVLKSQWGTLRLQRLQREVQRFARDLIRLLGEIISQRFSPEKLQAITQVQLPDQATKLQAYQAVKEAEIQTQAMAQMPQDPLNPQPAPAGPPPEAMEALELPTWDEVMQVLQSDELRGYKVDVETDSTVAETIQTDMQGLSEVLSALGQFLQIVGPMVQQGFMPIDAAKEIALTICRRAKMGQAVEDQIASIGGQQQQQMMQQAQQPMQDGMGQIMQALQELGKRGDDLGNGIQNGLGQLGQQIQVAMENVGRQNQLRAVS